MNTPIEFHVSDSLFDGDESCLLLGGLVLAGARIEAGMKVSVAIHRSLAPELPILRVEVAALPEDYVPIAVWLRAEDEQEAAILKGLDIRDELALVWNASDTVDASRHFAYGERRSEGAIDLRPFREDDRRH